MNNKSTHIGPWLVSTVTSPDLESTEKSYIDFLNYKVIEKEKITREQALSWNAYKNIGSKYSILIPESNENFFLRIIECPQPEEYRPLNSYGWVASELVVKDTDALENVFNNSPFEIIGLPADLDMMPDIRAMQVIGYAKEVFYLTMFKKEIAVFDLPKAKSSIDKMFIAVLASDDIAKVQQWYNKNFNIPINPITKTKINVLDTAFGLPENSTDYNLVVVPLQGKSYIEVDAYPKEAIKRPKLEGYLPPGNSIMSLLINSIDELDLPTITNEPFIIEKAPYFGRRATTVFGPVGELIELIELK